MMCEQKNDTRKRNFAVPSPLILPLLSLFLADAAAAAAACLCWPNKSWQTENVQSNQTNDSHLPPTRMEVGVTANNLPQFLVQIAGN